MGKHKIPLGAYYYAAGRKKPIAESTVATRDFLNIICQMNPGITFNQLYELLTDRTKMLPNHEAIGVVERYIQLGHGDNAPDWKYD